MGEISVNLKRSNLRTGRRESKGKPQKKFAKPKLIAIAVGLFAIAAMGLFSFWYFYYANDSGNQTETSNNEPRLYYISEDIPNSIGEEFSKIAEDYDLKETENVGKAAISMRAVSPGENTTEDTEDEEGAAKSVSFYQIWVVTKPWGKLADDVGTTISSISPEISIDDEMVSKVLGDNFSLSENPSHESISDVHLSTLDELDGTRQALNISGKSPFDKSWWESGDYPLVYTIRISTQSDDFNEFEDIISDLEETDASDAFGSEVLPQPDDFVSIIKTGTSVIGGPGWATCERSKGRVEYPIEEAKTFTAAADYTIISNESSFVDGCTQAPGTTAFCGRPDHLDNLLNVGADIISLTGNHMADYGRQPFSDAMSIYTQNGLEYFAAGSNTNEAWDPLVIETGSGKIAFLGFNKMGPDGVIATDSLAGAAYYDEAKFGAAMKSASKKADIVWVDTHLWPEYNTTPAEDQLLHGRESVDLGADIVTGVSSHEIQGMEFYEGKPVFWGLGNFLFDQMWSLETRQGLVLKLYVYDGAIRQIEVHPTLTYDYCQPRYLSGSEKSRVLNYFLGISDVE